MINKRKCKSIFKDVVCVAISVSHFDVTGCGSSLETKRLLHLLLLRFTSSRHESHFPNLELVAVKCQRLTSWHLTSHHRNTVSLVHRHVVALLCLDPLGFTAARVLVLNKEVETPTRVTFCIKTVAWIKVHYVEKAKERHSPRPSTHNTTDDSAINLLCCIYEL